MSGGKGSAPRPYSVDLNTFDNNWETIFRKKPPVVKMVDEDVDPDNPDGDRDGIPIPPSN